MDSIFLAVLTALCVAALLLSGRAKRRYLNLRAGDSYRDWGLENVPPILADKGAPDDARVAAEYILTVVAEVRLLQRAMEKACPRKARHVHHVMWDTFGHRYAPIIKLAIQCLAVLAML